MVKNVAEDEEGWFEGQIGEKEGVFPGNFVKEEQKPALPPKAATGKRRKLYGICVAQREGMCESMIG